jgi:hypothetical protein
MGFSSEMPKMKGFCETWFSWVESVLYNGTVAVKINGVVGPYF